MKRIIFFIFLLYGVLNLNAQFHYEIPEQQQTPAKPERKQSFTFDPKKLIYGGSFGMQFGNYTTIIISPQLGYKFSNKFDAGFGFSYSYFKDDFYYAGYRWRQSASYFGFNLFARYYPINNIILLVQPDINRMWYTERNRDTGYEFKEEKLIPAIIVGGGVQVGLLSLTLKYDIVQNKRSPYGNNIFYSVGFSF